MQATLHHQHRAYTIDLSCPLCIALPLRAGFQNPNCFYAPLPEITPVKSGDFVGDTQQGGAVNFKNVRLNPHGNGTHTECAGHIAKESWVLSDCLQQYFFKAELISLYPQLLDNGDRLILREHLEAFCSDLNAEALIIRTLPNSEDKKTMQYSGTNPPYLDAAAAAFLVEKGVEHLLLDLPSIDREEDGGTLAAHHIFWQYPQHTRRHCTITELIYVPDFIKDGSYFLQMHITRLQLDASPSMPVLYTILEEQVAKMK
ncbi:MAG: cyclase family protein [Sphingobacteriales bacterium]|nr:cyclase family protein [Sphingobacteriales bacterium]